MFGSAVHYSSFTLNAINTKVLVTLGVVARERDIDATWSRGRVIVDVERRVCRSRSARVCTDT